MTEFSGAAFPGEGSGEAAFFIVQPMRREDLCL